MPVEYNKNGPEKIIIILSLSVNIIFIGSFLFQKYSIKDAIAGKLDAIFDFTGSRDLKNKISAMDGSNESMLVEGRIESKFNKKIRIVIIGNSITYHPVLENKGWYQTCGMAASTIDKDYVHLLLAKTSQKKKCTIDYKITNLADFERNFSNFSFNKINNLIKFQPDVLICQLGENVSVESPDEMNLFGLQYKKLLSFFPKSKILVTTPFFPSYEKNIIIRQVACDSRALLVDLSHLALLDKKNFAGSEKNFSDDGVGRHPGDRGMENISELIFIALNTFIN